MMDRGVGAGLRAPQGYVPAQKKRVGLPEDKLPRELMVRNNSGSIHSL